MAMHIPRAPGFAQMMKDGAKVRCLYYRINIIGWLTTIIYY